MQTANVMLFINRNTSWKGFWNRPVEASITHVWEAIYANASTAVIAYVTIPTDKEPRSCLRGTLRAQKRIILAIVKLMSH